MENSMKEPVYIGIDLGGTAIKAVVTDPEGRVLVRREAATDGHHGRDALITRLAALVDEMRDELRSSHLEVFARAVGLSVPGVIGQAEGRVEFTVALTEDWNGFLAAAALEGAAGLPTILANDSQAATLGEHVAGGGRGCRDFVCITVGTGIGGGIVLEGHVYTGSRGMSGVFGHMTVVPDGPPCACGNCGCLELFASGTAIAKAGLEAGLGDDNAGEVSAERVTELAVGGDDKAREIYRRAGALLGVAVGNLVLTLNPRAIVVGGGVSRAGDLLLDPLRDEIERRTAVLSAERGGVEVIGSPLSGWAGAIGSAVWAAKGI
jgi:glucokinase